MWAIEAKTFSGYGGLQQTELPKPQSAKDRVLVRVTAAGVTPLEYTVLSGGHPRAKAPLVLGYKGAGVIEDAGDSGLRWENSGIATAVSRRAHRVFPRSPVPIVPLRLKVCISAGGQEHLPCSLEGRAGFIECLSRATSAFARGRSRMEPP